jgi:hypothetical protein
MVLTPLDFEKPIIELEAKIEELRHLSHSDDININKEVGDLQAKADRQLRQIYAKLTPWQKVQVARHPNRPHLRDYLSALIDEFTPLAGDRLYGEDAALVGGLGRLYGRPVVVMGHEKGHDIETRMRSGSWISPIGSRCRWSASSTRPAPIRASRRKSAARPRRSPGPSRAAWSCACPSSPSSSAKADRAAPSPSPRRTAS